MTKGKPQVARQKPVDLEGRYRAAYGSKSPPTPSVAPSSGPRWALIAFWIALVSLLALLSNAAFATSGWWRCGNGPHLNANGMDCCSIVDCTPVSTEAAFEARIGSQVEITRDGVTRTVIINAIHPSCDPQGHSWACTTGCLFRATGF